MIYDCFLFFNELDLLEIRLNELDNVVDKFVLVESSKTFSSKEKPFYFEENKNRFQKFLNKIIHVKVEDLPDIPPRSGRSGTFHNRHDVESFQRNCVSRGLKNCNPEDLILLSDIDEIPNPKSILEAYNALKNDKKQTVTFIQKFFYYYINGLCVTGNQPEPWLGTLACLYEFYPGSQVMRNLRNSSKYFIKDSGWHFSFLGGPESIAYKIESFAHAEWDNNHIKNKDRLTKAINNGSDIFERNDKPKQKYIPIDGSYPQYILNNLEKFSHLIKEL